MRRMSNEEFVRRVCAIGDRINRRYPNPSVPYDDAEGDWKHVHRNRARQIRRIYLLPLRWKKVPK